MLYLKINGKMVLRPESESEIITYLSKGMRYRGKHVSFKAGWKETLKGKMEATTKQYGKIKITGLDIVTLETVNNREYDIEIIDTKMVITPEMIAAMGKQANNLAKQGITIPRTD